MKTLIPQGLTGTPNYFGVLNNLMTLIICESLREIGEMACVTSAWSSLVDRPLKANYFLKLKWITERPLYIFEIPLGLSSASKNILRIFANR